MKLTITSITLKSPFQFFALAKQALAITQQLQQSNFKGYKKTGFWTQHYTMTLWDSEADLKAFAHSGAHVKAMQGSKKIAKEIRTLTVDTDRMPGWKEAKVMLEQAKPIRY